MADSMSDMRRQWISAGSVLAVDPRAQVLCPNCRTAVLEVEDVPANEDGSIFARYLRCPHCGAVEILDRLRRK